MNEFTPVRAALAEPIASRESARPPIVPALVAEADADVVVVGARSGVEFASGGFTHDGELVDNFLSHSIVGGGAAVTNTGDFIRIATGAGAQLRNMQEAWCGPVNLAKAARRDPRMQCRFLPRASSSAVDRCRAGGHLSLNRTHGR